MRITALEQEYRKDKIISHALRLFSEEGADQVTMDQIAQAAGVATSSLYRYFRNKTVLLEAVRQHRLSLQEDEEDQPSADGTSPNAS